MGRHERRQHALERRIGIIQVLEVDELGDERAPLALGDAHREQHQEGIEAGLLDLDAPRGQKLDTTAAGMPSFCIVPSADRPGDEDGDLDRVDQHVVLGQILEPVPLVAGLQHPVGLVVGRLLRPIASGCQTSNHHEPLSCFFDRGHGAAEAQRLVDRLLHQRATGRLLHHGGGHVAATR